MAQPLRILFVEDEQTDQELAEWQLRAQGLKLTGLRVETKAAFLQALEHFKPDLIISDYSMPRFDGMSALKLVQELHIEIPFILLTGARNEITAVDCMKAGAADYVIKEHIHRLPFAVQEALKRQQDRNEKMLAEAALNDRNRELLILNETAVNLAGSQFAQATYELIARKLKEISAGAAATFGVYNPIKKYITIKHAEIDAGIAKDLIQALGGKKFLQASFPVNDAMVQDLRSNPIRYGFSFNEITMGVVPELVGKIAQMVQNIDRFLGIAYFLDGKLFGTSIVALRAGTPDPSSALINSFAQMVSVALGRIRTSDELQESEASLKKAQQVAHIGSWTWRIQENQVVWSDEMFHIFGMQKESFSGDLAEVIACAIHPDDRLAIERSHRAVIEGKKPGPVEYRLVWPDGSVRVVYAEAGELLHDHQGKPEILTGIVQDITERRKAEQQIELQATALNSAANAMLITDRSGTIEWVNPAYTRLTGFPAEEAVGNNPRILKSGRQYPAYYKNLWDTILAGQVWRGELVNKRKDGSLYTEEETITPLINPDGKITHFIGIKIDISERKQHEAELIKRNQELNLLYEAGRKLSQTLDLPSIYWSFYQQIFSIMKCDHLYISGYYQENAVIIARYAVSDGKPVDVRFFPAVPFDPQAQGIQSQVIRNGKPRIISDYAMESGKSKIKYTMDAEGQVIPEDQRVKGVPFTQSALVIPILLKDQVHGVVQIQSCDLAAYSEEDLHIAEALVAQIAVASNNAQLYQQSLTEIEARKQAEAAQKQKRVLQEKIAALSRELSATLDLQVIYQTAGRHLQRMIDCPNFAIVLFDAQNETLRVAYLLSDDVIIDPTPLPILTYSPQNPFFDRSKAIATKTSQIVKDLEAKRKAGGGLLVGSEQEPQTGVYIPMLADDQVIGLMDLQSYQADAYTNEDLEWLSVVANQMGLAIQNARLFSQTQQRVAELSILHNIDLAITTSKKPHANYQKILGEIIAHAHVDATDILIFNPQNQLLEFSAGLGFLTSRVESTHLHIGEGLGGKAALEKHSVRVLMPSAPLPGWQPDPLWEVEGFAEYIGLPLIVQEEVIGVLELYSRQTIPMGTDWLNFMESVSQQVSIAVDNSQLFQNLIQSNQELIQAYNATIAGWSQAMDLRDKETEGHTERVTELTMRIAQQLGLKTDQLEHMRRGALLHDIGKLGVPDYILLKPGPLTVEEMEVMKKHPVFAYEMLKSIDFLQKAVEIPYCHHEKWDGSGYPRGLKGPEIPLSAQIFALVDVFDALSTDRPYRPAWTREKTLAYIQEQSGKQFDPTLVEVFLQLVEQ